jgi:lipopolysaccharide export system permease protein
VKGFVILDILIGGKERCRKNTDVYRQINDNEFLYVNSFNAESQVAFNFFGEI